MTATGEQPVAVERDGRGLIRMSEDACWRFLERQQLGRVAVVQFEHPMIYPVNYVVDGHTIVFRTDPGWKLVAASLGQRAVFEVDEFSASAGIGTSVIAHGHIREVTDRSEVARLRQLPLRPGVPGELAHFVRVEPQRLSGRSFEPPGR